MSRIAFVYVPLKHQGFAENLQVVDEDFGRLPPLSLAYAAAIAERAGHAVTLIDANALRLTLPEVCVRLRDWRPDALAFTLSTYMFRETVAWMQSLRQALGVPTIAGGINLALYPEETLAHPAIDYGVVSFAVRGLPLLLAALAEGRTPLGLPEVVARNQSGRPVVGPTAPERNPFLDLPRPARHLLPNHKYYSIISQRRNFTIMVTSTGCDSQCAFCAIPQRPRFKNGLEQVEAEVVECVSTHGIREIDFFDADFFADPGRAKALCRLLIARNLDLEWSCRARLDRLDREGLALARRAGCRQMYVGIESASLQAQGLLRKLLRPELVRDRLDLMREAGISPLGFFMLGVPGETWRSGLDTIRYAMRLPLDYAQFQRMIAKPGSALHREVVSRTGTDYWRDFVLGRATPKRMPNLWCGLSDRLITVLTQLGYLAFYFRPRQFWRALRRLRSREELLRTGRATLRMLGHVGELDA